MQTVMHTKGVLLIASTTSVEYNIISNMLTVIYARVICINDLVFYIIYIRARIHSPRV
jgi:hypothetical protein